MIVWGIMDPGKACKFPSSQKVLEVWRGGETGHEKTKKSWKRVGSIPSFQESRWTG